MFKRKPDPVLANVERFILENASLFGDNISQPAVNVLESNTNKRYTEFHRICVIDKNSDTPPRLFSGLGY